MLLFDGFCLSFDVVKLVSKSLELHRFFISFGNQLFVSVLDLVKFGLQLSNLNGETLSTLLVLFEWKLGEVGNLTLELVSLETVCVQVFTELFSLLSFHLDAELFSSELFYVSCQVLDGLVLLVEEDLGLREG